jgi:hypothetical protein
MNKFPLSIGDAEKVRLYPAKSSRELNREGKILAEDEKAFRFSKSSRLALVRVKTPKALSKLSLLHVSDFF